MTRSSNGNDTIHGSRTTKDGIYDSDQTASGYRPPRSLSHVTVMPASMHQTCLFVSIQPGVPVQNSVTPAHAENISVPDLFIESR